jgi:hypothetical protein
MAIISSIVDRFVTLHASTIGVESTPTWITRSIHAYVPVDKQEALTLAHVLFSHRRKLLLSGLSAAHKHIRQKDKQRWHSPLLAPIRCLPFICFSANKKQKDK